MSDKVILKIFNQFITLVTNIDLLSYFNLFFGFLLLFLAKFKFSMRKILFSLLTLTAINAANAQSVNIKFTEYDLPNGLHVILHEDHTIPTVAVSVLYHVGSKNEDPTRTGFAHFFEHLLFEGTENIGRGEYMKLIQNNNFPL